LRFCQLTILNNQQPTTNNQQPTTNNQQPRMLELRDISFSYRQLALRGVSLSVRAGEIVGLLGPNGAGKSTLLKIAYGALKASSGEVLLDGRPLSEIPRREIARQMAVVTQTGELEFSLTALEYVLAGRYAHTVSLGFDSPRDVSVAMEALRQTDATAFAERPFNELSSGEKQRVALARALAQEPRVLLLDEPTANADIAHQFSLLAFVRALTRSRQIAALVITHEINLAGEFADRIALLKEGALIACGAPPSVMTETALGQLFDTPLIVDSHPLSGAPRVSWVAPRQGPGL
jgi:iron complex transport system ATP-binding protein